MAESSVSDKFGLKTPRMQRFLELYERAWASPGSGDLADFWTQDAVVHTAESDPLSGEEIAAYIAKFLEMAPDLSSRPIAAGESENVLFVQFRIAGTFGGRHFEWDGVDRLDFRPGEDRAMRGEAFFDMRTAREAIAAAEAAAEQAP